MDWPEGEIIADRYSVCHLLGKGNFGTVHKVRHLRWRRDIAVKQPGPFLLSRRELWPDIVQMADSWAELGVFPHIVTCFYPLEIEEIPCVFTEFVAGQSLREKLGQPLNLKQALDFAIQISDAMSHAHRHDIVHASLKPEDCLFSPEGTLKVTDFGLDSLVPLSKRYGTDLEYRSPEQLAGEKAVPQSDVFSLGVILYEMITSRRPFNREPGESPEEYRARIAGTGWSYPEAAGKVPSDLRDLIRQCLRGDPAERPQEFGGLGDTLGKLYLEATGTQYVHKEAGEIWLNAASLNKKGACLYDLGYVEESASAFGEAVKTDPSCLEYGYNHALLLWRRGKMSDSQAVDWIEMKVESSAREWTPLYLLGLVHATRKDYARAEAALSEAMELDPARNEIKSLLEEMDLAKEDWPHFQFLLSGHNAPVSCFCFSDDGQFAVSGAEDGSLRYWDLATRESLWKVGVHQGSVNCLCLAQGLHLAFSGGNEKTLHIWDLNSGECLLICDGHTRPLKTLDVVPGRNLAVSGSEDKTIRLWDLATGKCMKVLEGHDRSVDALAVSLDERLLVSGSEDRTVRLWDLESGDCLRVFRGHGRAVISVCLAEDGRIVCSASNDQTVRVWDLHTGECLRTLKIADRALNYVSFLRDGRFALSKGGDKPIRLWDLAGGMLLRTLDEISHQNAFAVASGEDTLSVPASDGRSIAIWYLGGLNPVDLPLVPETFEGSEIRLSSSADFALLKNQAVDCIERSNWRGASEYLHRARCLPGYKAHPEIMDLFHEIGHRGVRKALRGAWLKNTLRAHDDWVSAVAILPDGKSALSASDDRTLRCWDLRTGENMYALESRATLSSIAVSPEGDLAAAGARDGGVRLWHLGKGELLNVLRGHQDWVSTIAISPDCRFTVSGSDDGSIRLWDMVKARTIRTMDGSKVPVRSLAVGPDGSFALVANDDDSPCIWSLIDGRRIRVLEGHKNWVTCVAIAANGVYGLTGSLDNTIRMWELRTGKCLCVLSGHEGWVRTVALSPEGRFALSGGHDNSLRVWDLRTGECIYVLEGHQDWVSSVALSPDGRYAVSGSHDNTVRIWEFDWAYDFPNDLDWAEGALPYVQNFIRLHRSCSDDTASENPNCDEEDFEVLLRELSFRGYGWLKPSGIARKLAALAPAIDKGALLVDSLAEIDDGASTKFRCFCCGQAFQADSLDETGFCLNCRRHLARPRTQPEHPAWWKKLMGKQQDMT